MSIIFISLDLTNLEVGVFKYFTILYMCIHALNEVLLVCVVVFVLGIL